MKLFKVQFNIFQVYFFLWRFDPITSNGLPLRLNAVTLIANTTLSRTPLDNLSAQCRDLYIIIHNTHRRQTIRVPAGFDPTIPEKERRQMHALDRAVTTVFNLYMSS
jgi:hypothetical protein